MKDREETMKKIFCCIVLCGLFFCAADLRPANGETTPPAENQGKSGISGQKEEMKAIVARVNGVDLSLKALIRMESLIRMQREEAAKAGHEAGGSADSWGEALDRLIVQELMYQKAKSMGMKAEEKDIVHAIANLKKNLGGEEAYKLFLEKEKTTEEDLRAELERGQVLKRIYTQEVDNKVVVNRGRPESRIREGKKKVYYS
jgi:hypothetical protein